MELKVIEKNDSAIIEITGKLIGGPFMQEMSETLHKLLDEAKKTVIVDMSGVSMMTSSGMGVLVSGYTTMKNGDGILKLANVSDKVAGLLAITNLDKVFEYYPSVDEALASD